MLTFNVDIQGTAAVALGTILGAVNVTGNRLKDQQIVMLGAGSAGIGVADLLRAAMQADGLSDNDARSRFWVVDRDGLLHAARTDLTAEQRVYAQPMERVSAWPRTLNSQIGLADVIGKLDATMTRISGTPPAGASDSRTFGRIAAEIRTGRLGGVGTRPWNIRAGLRGGFETEAEPRESIQIWGLCHQSFTLLDWEIGVPTAEYGRELVVQCLDPHL